MTAMQAKSNKGCHKAGNSSGNSKSNLLCTHCQRKGHVESTCWTKYPYLKDKSKPTTTGEARVAFCATTRTARKAQSGKNDEYSNPKHWILDSGASEHFTPYKHVLIDYKTLDKPVEVNTAKGKLFGIGTGNVHLTVEGQGGFTPITLHKQCPAGKRFRNQHASCERNKYSRRQLYCGENSLPWQALDTLNGRRRTPCAQNGRAQIKGVSTTQASAISGMASSLRSSGAVEPPESRETCRGNGNRPTDFSRGRRQLRSLHFRFPNSQPQRCAHDKTKPLTTLQNRMELPNVQTGQYAKGYAQSSQKPVFPKNSGQNSHVQSPISKIAARQALSTTGLPTRLCTVGNPTYLTSLPSAQGHSFICPRRRPKSWILAISRELWWGMVEATNIEFGFLGQTRSEYLEMSSLSEKLQEQ